MSLPILFAEITDTVIRLTDTVFLARVGTVELGAFALADTLLSLWFVPVIGLVEGMVIVIGRRVGQQRARSVRDTFVRGMLLVLAVAVALAAALNVGAPVLGDLVAESAAVGLAVTDYLFVAALGLVFSALNLGFASLYIGLARTGVLVTAATVMSVTNFLGSYALILGRFGFPELGIEGAAWSFVAAEVVGFAYLLAHTWRHGVLGVPAGTVAEPARDRSVWGLVRLSAPIALSALVEGIRWLLFFMILEQVSEEAVAGASVVYACFATMLIATDALADTTYSLVSNLVGRHQERQLGRLLSRVIRANFWISLPLVVLAVAFPDIPLWLFALEGGGTVSPAPDLQVAALGVLVMIPAEMWISAVAGTGDTDAALGLEILMSVGFVSWAYWALLVAGLPTAVAWLAVAMTALAALPLAWWWVRSERWKRRTL